MKTAVADQSSLAADLERVKNEKQALIRQTAALQRDYDELKASQKAEMRDQGFQQELNEARQTAQQLTTTVSTLQQAQRIQSQQADSKIHTLCADNEQLEQQLGRAHARAVELESSNERLHGTVEQML